MMYSCFHEIANKLTTTDGDDKTRIDDRAVRIIAM